MERRRAGDGAEDLVPTPRLNRCTDPEQKRKIIGDTFMKVKDEILQLNFNLNPDDVLLAQGQF